jgi:hypothetical protein
MTRREPADLAEQRGYFRISGSLDPQEVENESGDGKRMREDWSRIELSRTEKY